jgi:uncharacterized membrane protein YqiK
MFSSNDSVVLVIVGIVAYVLVMLIGIFIGYLILKAAVKNGTLAAMRQAQREGLIR